MTIPQGIVDKALRLGLGVEERGRRLAAMPPRLRFVNRGRPASEWMSLADAHVWLDGRMEKGDRHGQRDDRAQ